MNNFLNEMLNLIMTYPIAAIIITAITIKIATNIVKKIKNYFKLIFH